METMNPEIEKWMETRHAMVASDEAAAQEVTEGLEELLEMLRGTGMKLRALSRAGAKHSSMTLQADRLRDLAGVFSVVVPQVEEELERWKVAKTD